MKDGLTRRAFLKAGAASGAVAGLNRIAFSAPPEKKVRWGILGVGVRGSYMMGNIMAVEGSEVTAICDIDEGKVNNAIDVVNKATGKKPAGYSAGPTDYRRMLERQDVDAVFLATPVTLHTPMAVDALQAGKHVLSEVGAALLVDECWKIVEAAEKASHLYMMSENVNYYRQNLMVLNMVKRGVFGDLTYSECGYVHSGPDIGFAFAKDGSLTWRGGLSRDYIGNWYPTHALGPVCQWLGINRGDRFETLVAVASGQASLKYKLLKQFGANAPQSQIKFLAADTTSTLIRTAKGALIDLRFDIFSPRPVVSTTHFTLQGTKASYEDRRNEQVIWIEGESEKYAWEPLEKHAAKYEHPQWKEWESLAIKAKQNPANFIVVREFVEAVRQGKPSPVDAYDSAIMSCITDLAERSLKAGGKTVEVPDFTKGKWKERKS